MMLVFGIGTTFCLCTAKVGMIQLFEIENVSFT